MLAFLSGLLLGLVFMAAGLAAGPDRLGRWIGIEGNLAAEFAAIAGPTLLCLPVLFAGAMAQGLLEGAFRFPTVRLAELAATIAFALAAVVLVFERRHLQASAWLISLPRP